MDLLTDFSTFECVHHAVDHEKILSTIFDIYDPCSFCKNRRTISNNSAGIGFYDQRQRKWEFPFVFEANCQNFTRKVHGNQLVFYDYAGDLANEIRFITYKPSRFGPDFDRNFYEIELANLRGITFNRRPIDSRSLIYPNDWTGAEFSREMLGLREELDKLIRLSSKAQNSRSRNFNIRTDNIETFASDLSYNLELLGGQIDILTTHINKQDRREPIHVHIMKFVSNTVFGGALWDIMKSMTQGLIKTLQENQH